MSARLIQSQPVCLNCFCDLTDGLGLIDLLRKDDLLCGYCRQQLIPLKRRVAVLDMQVYGLYEYDAFFEKLIFQVKESKDVTLAPVFLHPHVSALRKLCQDKTVILVPSSEKKHKTRGFDALVMFYKALGVPLLCPFEKDDVKQSQRNAMMRSRIKNHIRLVHPEQIEGTDIVLLDDVCTTGYSLKACVDLIKPLAKSSRIVVLAIHPDNLKTRSPHKNE